MELLTPYRKRKTSQRDSIPDIGIRSLYMRATGTAGGDKRNRCKKVFPPPIIRSIWSVFTERHGQGCKSSE